MGSISTQSHTPSPCCPDPPCACPPWLLLDPHATCQSLPLPRGPSQQLALQPLDQVLRHRILGLHGHWFLPSLRCCCLADHEEPIDVSRWMDYIHWPGFEAILKTLTRP